MYLFEFFIPPQQMNLKLNGAPLELKDGTYHGAIALDTVKATLEIEEGTMAISKGSVEITVLAPKKP